MTPFGLWSVINTTWNTWFTTQLLYHMCVCIFKHIHNGVKNVITMYDNWELTKFSIYSLIGLHICILWRSVRTMSIYDYNLSNCCTSIVSGIICDSVISDVVIKKSFSSFIMDIYIIHRFIFKLISKDLYYSVFFNWFAVYISKGKCINLIFFYWRKQIKCLWQKNGYHR